MSMNEQSKLLAEVDSFINSILTVKLVENILFNFKRTRLDNGYEYYAKIAHTNHSINITVKLEVV